MYREERVITGAFVNGIVPLIILAMMANFSPYTMVFVPIVEQDICWLYFLTRAPYQLQGEIPSELYWSAFIMKYIIIVAEMLAILVYAYRIRNYKMNQINIGTESTYITASWFILNACHIAFRVT